MEAASCVSVRGHVRAQTTTSGEGLECYNHETSARHAGLQAQLARNEVG